jgi:hypothetical protein
MGDSRKARIITLIVLAAAFAIIVWQKSGWKTPALGSAPKAQFTPQDAIYAMLDAARQGDVPKYLAAYTGRMEAAIRQAIAEKTESGFADYLRQSNAAIKGIAITEPEPVSDTEVKVRVEYVYQDRNEVQFLYLEQLGDSWKIARLDTAERVKTLIPYGTPVEQEF